MPDRPSEIQLGTLILGTLMNQCHGLTRDNSTGSQIGDECGGGVGGGVGGGGSVVVWWCVSVPPRVRFGICVMDCAILRRSGVYGFSEDFLSFLFFVPLLAPPAPSRLQLFLYSPAPSPFASLFLFSS